MCSLKRVSLASPTSSGNKILTKLPDTIGNLAQLQLLNLDKCKALESLPDSIGQLKSLRSLLMRECKLVTALPDSIGGCVNLVEVGLSKCMGLTTLPDTIAQWIHVEDLILAKCKGIETLPEAIGELKSLSWLDLRNCKRLVQLPDSVGNLSQLRHLDLSTCKNLKNLPESLANLKDHLDILNVSTCISLEAIPPALEVLQSVTVGWPPVDKKSDSTWHVGCEIVREALSKCRLEFLLATSCILNWLIHTHDIECLVTLDTFHLRINRALIILVFLHPPSLFLHWLSLWLGIELFGIWNTNAKESQTLIFWTL